MKAKSSVDKIAWSSRIVAPQPRIRLMRSFDELCDTNNYVLRISGTCGDEKDEFRVAIGKAAHEKHRFCAGMEVSDLAIPIPCLRLETARGVKTSGLKVLKDAEDEPSAGSAVSWRVTRFENLPQPEASSSGYQNLRIQVLNMHLKCSTCTSSAQHAPGDAG